MTYCQRCSGKLERKPATFHYRGRSFPGLVCPVCQSGYEDPESPFLKWVEGVVRAEASPKEDVLSRNMKFDLWYCAYCQSVIYRPWGLNKMTSMKGEEIYGRCPACEEEHEFNPVKS